MADENGVLKSNQWGITGEWFTFDDSDFGGTSSVRGWTSERGAYCAEGEAAQVIDVDEDGTLDYSVNMGAGIGFHLCSADNNFFTIGDCPVDLTGIVGFRLTVTGEIPDSELRVTMAEQNRDEPTFLRAMEVGVETDYLFADAVVQYNVNEPAVDVSNINGLQFHVASFTTSATPFDFCIEEISVLIETK